MVMNGSIDVLVTLEFAFILALVFGLGLGLDLGLGFTLVHNILLDGAIRYICALRMDEGELKSEGIESYELQG